MLRNKRIRSSLTGLLLLLFSTAARTDEPAPAIAPLPAQITTAKTVFLSNAGEDRATYSYYYSAINQWGHFKLKPTPAEADLILEVSYDIAWQVEGDGGAHPTEARHILTLIDPSTHVTLWKFVEPVEHAVLDKTRAKHSANARAQIITDLRTLIEQP